MRAALILCLAICLLGGDCLAGSKLLSKRKAPSETISEKTIFTGPRFSVEDLVADVHAEGDIIAVSGKIRNYSQSLASGYVIVYFKDSKDRVIHAVEANVNERQPIAHGDTGLFEAQTSLDNTPGATNVSVEFVNR